MRKKHPNLTLPKVLFCTLSLLVAKPEFLSAQNNLRHSFRSLSAPEKRWVIFHPFIAKKSWHLTQQARAETKLVTNDSRLDGDSNGGQVDAFRHGYWMALLSREICWRKARSLGKAHEKGNFRSFKKHTLEDSALPDSMASVMDAFNNAFGIEQSRTQKALPDSALKEAIIQAILNGKLRILWKNTDGRFLDCKGDVVPDPVILFSWSQVRCLVPSDTRPKSRD